MNDKITWRINRPLLLVSIAFLFIGCGGGGGGGLTDGGMGTVAQAVAAKIVAPSGNTQIAQGDAVEFRGSATGGTPPYRYLWSFSGAAPSSTAQNPGSMTFNTTGTYAVVFQATDATGITSTASDSITVTGMASGTNTTPTASITSPPGNVTITAGQSVEFKGSVAGGDLPISYLWTFGDGAADSDSWSRGRLSSQPLERTR